MPQTEAEGRLNLYDDVTPFEKTDKINRQHDSKP